MDERVSNAIAESQVRQIESMSMRGLDRSAIARIESLEEQLKQAQEDIALLKSEIHQDK